jgi:hypothetical protein
LLVRFLTVALRGFFLVGAVAELFFAVFLVLLARFFVAFLLGGFVTIASPGSQHLIRIVVRGKRGGHGTATPTELIAP